MVSGISSRFQLLSQSPGQVSHVLRTRSPLGLPEQAPWTSFDLHVLSTPPAFILSQDQTLQQKPVRDEPGSTASASARRSEGEIPPTRRASLLWWQCHRITELPSAGMPTAELTDSRDRHSTTPCCPHWRSVFSSVFKEPKLMSAPDGGLRPAGRSLRRRCCPCSAGVTRPRGGVRR